MTQTEKDLLLKDLCSRLPYNNLKVRGAFIVYNKDINRFVYEECDKEFKREYLEYYETLKPYLRPMSSMTEEERKEFIHHAGYEVEESVNGRHYEFYLKDYVGTLENPICNYDAVDWLNANNFDYRGLIPMGLANDATNLNIY